MATCRSHLQPEKFRERLRSIVMSIYVCVCLYVCPRGYHRNHTRDLYQILGMLPMSVARFSSGMLTIGRIAYRQEGGDGSLNAGEV